MNLKAFGESLTNYISEALKNDETGDFFFLGGGENSQIIVPSQHHFCRSFGR